MVYWNLYIRLVSSCSEGGLDISIIITSDKQANPIYSYNHISAQAF